MSITKIFSAIDISASGLTLQRKKMDTIASNLANVDSVGQDGKPYRRQEVKSLPGNPVTFSEEMNSQSIPLETSDQNHIANLPANFESTDYTVRDVSGKVVQDSSATKMVYDPSNPNADKSGYVAQPNINVVTEMVDMISATRSYEANVTAIGASKNIIKDSFDI